MRCRVSRLLGSLAPPHDVDLECSTSGLNFNHFDVATAPVGLTSPLSRCYAAWAASKPPTAAADTRFFPPPPRILHIRSVDRVNSQYSLCKVNINAISPAKQAIFVRELCELSRLVPPSSHRYVRACRLLHCRPDATLFDKGDDDRGGFFVVLTGSVRVEARHQEAELGGSKEFRTFTQTLRPGSELIPAHPRKAFMSNLLPFADFCRVCIYQGRASVTWPS
jgi:hypothetical protein